MARSWLATLAPIYRNAVYVMRHGRTVLDEEKRSDGWLDYPLSDKGRIDLINTHLYLKNAPITEVWSPSLRRAHETAHIVASGILTHPTVKIAEEARTWNLGDMIGGRKKANKPAVKFYMEHPEETPRHGESMKDFNARWIPWLYKLVRRSEAGEGPFLVVTSGTNLREIGVALLGDKDRFDLDEAGLMVLMPEKNGGITGQVIFGHKDGSEEDFS
jgi:broad specificity phosphatase PhoE